MIEEVENKIHLDKLKKENNELLIIIFYSDSSANSKKALDILEAIKEKNKKVPIFGVNASRVRDIHPIYKIDKVPSVLVLKKGIISNIIYGFHNKDYYEMLLYDNHISMSSTGEEGSRRHRVVVYTSPACSWCRTVKSYLMKNHVAFREVNIAEDEKAAKDLIRRSGQMGVPQTDIDGRIVVGFDKKKIDNILGLRSN